MPTSTAGRTPRPAPSKAGRASQRTRQRGYTYAMVLVAVVLVGIFAGVANLRTARVVQADREAELLFRGQAYRKAIASHLAATGRYPRDLRELLRDASLSGRAHLRTLYPDPMADATERAAADSGWRLLRASDGGISGVASRSRGEPLKKANFPAGLEQFEGAGSYADWQFEHLPRPAVGRGRLTPAG